MIALFLVLNWKNSQSSQMPQSRGKEMFKVDSILPTLYKDTSIVAYEGIIKPAVNVDLTFSIDGILMQGDYPIEVGTMVRENDILFKLDLRQLFKELSAKKKELKRLAEGLDQEIASIHSDQKDAWESFKSNLSPSKRLPGFPPFLTKSKKPIIEEFINAYDELVRIEARTKKYYVFAPFPGTIVSVKKKIGEQIRTEECVAQLSPFQILIAQFKISKVDLDLIKLKEEVKLSLNKKQFKGRVIKISLSKEGTYAMVECSLAQSVTNRTEKINLHLQRKSACYYIPSHLLRNDSLWISRLGQSMKIHATILGWKKDSVAIKELKLGDFILRKRPKTGVISCP